ncbi:MAG: HPr family phosphocarrier protein [Deltaproteobacteria bacterium]|nr:MAG: HPr family phosphocarrier protein [Deltaproteobacteria bacterium]
MSAKRELVKQFEIVNRLGLHARAAAVLVQTAQQFTCDVEIIKDSLAVNGKSIMGILMLAAAKGVTITVKTNGTDADAAMDAIGNLVRAGFGEND